MKVIYTRISLALILVFAVKAAVSQQINIRNETFPVSNDTLIRVAVDEYRGSISWQCSYDSVNWVTTNNEDTLKLRVFYPSFYRAIVSDSDCDPIYSEIIEIENNDSTKSDSFHFLNISVGKDTLIEEGNYDLHCRKIGAEYLYEGDIILNINSSSTKGAALPIEQYSNRFFGCRWPNGQIFYKIEVNDESLKERIHAAISYWKSNTKLSFTEHTNQSDYIVFVQGTVSKSYVGMIQVTEETPFQFLHLTANARQGTIIHEIGHAVGLFHEHSRPDRNDYVDVHPENLKEAIWQQQLVKKPYAESYDTPYDYGSIMHYRSLNWDPSLVYDPNMPIITYKGTMEPVKTQHEILSEGDMLTVSRLYPVPTIVTSYPSDISSTNLTTGGNVIDDGGAVIEKRGICWSNEGIPDITGGNVLEAGGGAGIFSVTLSDLTPNTTYNIRSFAINRAGTFYGNLESLKTKTGLPSVAFHDSVSAVTHNSAVCGVVVSDDGGSAVTARGVCWSKSPNPSVDSEYKTLIGYGTGSFISTITNLEPNTAYYVKAYATNSGGTAYSDTTLNFTTLSDDKLTGTFTDSRDGNTYEWVKIGELVWMAENLAYLPQVSPSAVGSEDNIHYYVYGYEGTDVTEAQSKNNYIVYGVLYNGPAALSGAVGGNYNSGNIQGVCPAGWHLPGDMEWKSLELAIGMTQTEVDTDGMRGFSSPLKETYGWNSNKNGTNESGFSALPAGYRRGYSFSKIGDRTYFWSSTAYNESRLWCRILYSTATDGIDKLPLAKYFGYSVRCVKD